MKWTKEEIAAHRKAWIAALRSGEYRQMPGVLRNKAKNHDEYSYCVIGVACDIAPIGKWTGFQDCYYSFPVFVGDIHVHDSESDVHMRDGVSRYYGFIGNPYVEGEKISSETRDELLEHLLSDYTKDDLINRRGTVYLTKLNDAGVGFRLLAKVMEEALPEPERLITKKES